MTARAGRRVPSRVRSHVVVEGAVQGVGYRPFVHRLATQLGVAGFVGNDADGVFIEIEGTCDQVDRFVDTLRTDSPPLAVVERVLEDRIDPAHIDSRQTRTVVRDVDDLTRYAEAHGPRVCRNPGSGVG